jgi:hypothetical protein
VDMAEILVRRCTACATHARASRVGSARVQPLQPVVETGHAGIAAPRFAVPHRDMPHVSGLRHRSSSCPPMPSGMSRALAVNLSPILRITPWPRADRAWQSPR